MTRVTRHCVRRATKVFLAATLLAPLTACSGDAPDPTAGPDQASDTPTESPQPSESASSAAPSGGPAPADDEPFGPLCRRFKTDSGVGPAEFRNDMDFGIFSVIFNDLIGDGASIMNNAELWRMSDTTYFLPTNEAIDLLNNVQLGNLLHDKQQQKATMGRHIVPETLAPSALAGEHETAAGGSTLQVTVDGEDVSVGLQGADVVCGNIELEEGIRVYVIDQLLIT